MTDPHDPNDPNVHLREDGRNVVANERIETEARILKAHQEGHPSTLPEVIVARPYHIGTVLMDPSGPVPHRVGAHAVLRGVYCRSTFRFDWPDTTVTWEWWPHGPWERMRARWVESGWVWTEVHDDQ